MKYLVQFCSKMFQYAVCLYKKITRLIRSKGSWNRKFNSHSPMVGQLLFLSFLIAKVYTWVTIFYPYKDMVIRATNETLAYPIHLLPLWALQPRQDGTPLGDLMSSSPSRERGSLSSHGHWAVVGSKYIENRQGYRKAFSLAIWSISEQVKYDD